MKQISIVVPLLGACEWLAETLESIDAQTLPHDGLEAIIVTDGKDGDNASRAREFLEERGIAAIVVIDPKCSAGSASNKGWRLASADWIQFLDVGDVLASTKLEVQAGLLAGCAGDVDVVCSQWRHLRHWNGGWQPFGSAVKPALSEPMALRLISASIQSLGPVLIRRSALERVGGISHGVEFSSAEHLLLKLVGTGSRFIEETSGSPQFLLRQTPREQSRADKIALARQRVENVMTAEAILKAGRRTKLSRDNADELEKLANARLNALYWLDSSAFAEYCERLPGTSEGHAPKPDAPAASRQAPPEIEASSPPMALRGLRAVGAHLAAGARSLARLPLTACRVVAAALRRSVRWVLDGLSAATRALVWAMVSLVKLPLAAARWVAAAAVSAMTWVSLAVGAASRAVGHIAFRAASLAIALCSDIAWVLGKAAEGTIRALRAVMRGVVWLLLLPVLLSRAAAAGLVAGGRWLGRGIVSLYRAVIAFVIWLIQLPVRLLCWLGSQLAAAISATIRLMRHRYVGVGALGALVGVVATAAVTYLEPMARLGKLGGQRLAEAPKAGSPSRRDQTVTFAGSVTTVTGGGTIATIGAPPSQAVATAEHPARQLQAPDNQPALSSDAPVPAGTVETEAGTRAEPASPDIVTKAIPPRELALGPGVPSESGHVGGSPDEPPSGAEKSHTSVDSPRTVVAASEEAPPSAPPALADPLQPPAAPSISAEPGNASAALPPPVAITRLDEMLPPFTSQPPMARTEKSASEQSPVGWQHAAPPPPEIARSAKPGEGAQDKPAPLETAAQEPARSNSPAPVTQRPATVEAQPLPQSPIATAAAPPTAAAAGGQPRSNGVSTSRDKLAVSTIGEPVVRKAEPALPPPIATAALPETAAPASGPPPSDPPSAMPVKSPASTSGEPPTVKAELPLSPSIATAPLPETSAPVSGPPPNDAASATPATPAASTSGEPLAVKAEPPAAAPVTTAAPPEAPAPVSGPPPNDAASATPATPPASTGGESPTVKVETPASAPVATAALPEAPASASGPPSSDAVPATSAKAPITTSEGPAAAGGQTPSAPIEVASTPQPVAPAALPPVGDTSSSQPPAADASPQVKTAAVPPIVEASPAEPNVPSRAAGADESRSPSSPQIVGAVAPQTVAPPTAPPVGNGARSVPAAPPERDVLSGPTRPPINPKERARAEQLVVRGERSLADGNVAQARQFFLRAANAGYARAAFLLAATYDSRELGRLGALGVQPNGALAKQWYERARELGSKDAQENLERLGNPSP